MEERAILFDSRFLFRYCVSMIRYFRAAHMEDWESVRGQNHFGAVKIITANVRLFLVLVAWVFFNVIIFACCVVVLVLRDLHLMLGILVIAFCHRRTGRGGEGGCSPPKFWATQIFWTARENLGKACF